MHPTESLASISIGLAATISASTVAASPFTTASWSGVRPCYGLSQESKHIPYHLTTARYSPKKKLPLEGLVVGRIGGGERSEGVGYNCEGYLIFRITPHSLEGLR